MKALKIAGLTILGLVLLIILVVVVLGLIAPRNYHVERSIGINAPQELVFRQVQYWKNWTAWSPWAEHDSTMKVTVEGIDGRDGSVYHWEGDPKITGSGEMTNTGVTPNEKMTYHLHFMVPWESESDGHVEVEKISEDSTKATWAFYGDYPFPWNAMLLFMPMEKMMGPNFERGMELLKEVCEKKREKISSFEIQTERFRGGNYAAIRKEVMLSDMRSFFETSYSTLQKAIQESGVSFAGVPAGFFYEWDEETGKTEVAAAIPVRGRVQGDSVQMIRIAPSKALVINYYGPYENVELAHFAMMDYFQNNNLTLAGSVVEEYVTDPQQELDPNKWLTRVIYPVQ